ncbi:MAG TPA: response regulator [Fibrobacteria bacterium]|nr:response regulator [Fibrobacteria bacterium]
MNKRILVIDDHPINLKLACDVMEHEGYIVDRADAADAALACIARAMPDIILMDLAMPGMDGLTLTRLLRSRADTREVPVVALTAFAMKRDEEKALEAGCDDYVSKPIDTRTLPARLAALLASRARASRRPSTPAA